MKQLLCMSDSFIYIYTHIVSARDLYIFMKQLQCMSDSFIYIYTYSFGSELH